MPAGSKPRRSPVRTLVVLALLLVAGYVAGWFFVRDQMVEGVGRQMDALRADGYRVDWASTSTHGFPFRIDVTLEEPTIASQPGPTAWSWAADALTIRLAPPEVTSLQVLPEGVQTIGPPSAEPITLLAERARARVAADRRGLTRLTIDSGPWIATRADSGAEIARADMISGEVTRANTAVGSHEIALTMANIQQARTPDAAPVDITLAATLIAGDVFAAMGGVSETALAAWAGADGAVDVANAEASWGEATLQLRGRVTIDDAGHWDGALRLTARQPGEAMVRLSELGLIHPDRARQVGAAADAAAGQEGVMTAPFRLRGGAVYFMGFPVGEAAPAF